jgi:large subunit ribosomal protein L7/L12
MPNRLEELLKKKEALNAEIQKIKAIQNTKKRKEDTRKKILLGALIIEMMERGELDRNMLMKRLDRFLFRVIDRRLFNMPIITEIPPEEKK